MPGKKRTLSRRQSSMSNITDNGAPLATCSNLEITSLTNTSSNLSENDINFLKDEIEEKFHEQIQRLESKKEYMLSKLDIQFETMMLRLSDSLLNTPIELDDESLKNIFINGVVQCNETKPCSNMISEQVPATIVKRRRSKSTSSCRYRTTNHGVRRSERKRSSSVDVFKTPLNRVCLSTLTATKKYTVTKPKRLEDADTGISVKRIMRPNEEAISTCGSPLFINPSIAVAPTVNIPLPGGVVMNIEPKIPKGQITVPQLDETTKQQLKILCQQLNNMF